MLEKRKLQIRNSKPYVAMKWVLTAISGILTTAFIFLLGPVSS